MATVLKWIPLFRTLAQTLSPGEHPRIKIPPNQSSGGTNLIDQAEPVRATRPDIDVQDSRRYIRLPSLIESLCQTAERQLHLPIVSFLIETAQWIAVGNELNTSGKRFRLVLANKKVEGPRARYGIAEIEADGN